MIYEEHNYVLETDEAPPVLGLPPPPGWFYISSRCTHIHFCEIKTGELVATCLFFNVKSKKQKKTSLYPRYYAEARNECRDPFTRLSVCWATQITQLSRNVATVVSRCDVDLPI